MRNTISRIERVPLEFLWAHEALDFTPWLADNIDVLNEIMDIELSNPETEQAAGTFSVDIVAEDSTGGPVVIENQLRKSDHDHLGKLLTYLSSMGAKVAIWIVADARPEHINAVSWLNESSSASFYLLKVEAIRIGESNPAPLFTLIVGPSEEARSVGRKKKEMAEHETVRYNFWSQLLDHIQTRTPLHANLTPSRGTWLSTGVGMSALGLEYVLRKNNTIVKLFIDRGKDSEDINKKIFDEFYKHKDAIEEAFGSELTWDRGEGKRSCNILKQLSAGGIADEERWAEIHKNMCDNMIKLESVLNPYIKKLKKMDF